MDFCFTLDKQYSRSDELDPNDYHNDFGNLFTLLLWQWHHGQEQRIINKYVRMQLDGNESYVQENYDFINGTAQSTNGDDSWMDLPTQFGDIFFGKIEAFD